MNSTIKLLKAIIDIRFSPDAWAWTRQGQCNNMTEGNCKSNGKGNGKRKGMTTARFGGHGKPENRSTVESLHPRIGSVVSR